jgi:hypothetical protein
VSTERSFEMTDLSKLVKPLVWQKHPDADHDPECNEHYGGGQNNLAGQNEYAVYPHPCAIGYFVLDVMGNRCDEDFPSIKAAKAAAQADYTARILAALDADAVAALIAEAEERGRKAERDVFYIDCEFDGHGGPLLSIAMVRSDGYGLHVQVQAEAIDPWVVANVIPIMGSHEADESCTVLPFDVGERLRSFIGDCQTPHIVADSPVDIGRFCRAISTGHDGGWVSTQYPRMTFAVHNIDCYPTTLSGAVQHNAWWDAMALRAAIRARGEA